MEGRDLRVGILTSFYPEIHGGAEVSLGVLLDGLSKLSLDPIVLTPSRRMSNVNGSIVKVGHLGRTPKIVRLSGFPGLNSIFARSISKSLKEHKIDLLHVNDTYALRAAARAVTHSKIPLVLSFHNNLNVPNASYSIPFPLSSWLDSRDKGVLEAARECSFTIATSNYIAQRLIEAGLSPALVKPIYIGGAISLQDKPAHPSEHSTMRVLCVGTMQYHKGFQNVAIAAKKLREDSVPVEVVFVGVGPYLRRLRSLVAGLGLGDQIRLAGHVNWKELERLYDWCDMVVVPTITPEPFGRVAVEAMSRGRAVIGTKSGGLTEIIDDGATGFLVPPGDPSAIAERILTFRNQSHLLTEMGERALQKCRVVFDQRMIASQVLDVYRSLASNSRGAIAKT